MDILSSSVRSRPGRTDLNLRRCPLNLQIFSSRGCAVLIPSMPLKAEGDVGDPMLRLMDGVIPAVNKGNRCRHHRSRPALGYGAKLRRIFNVGPPLTRTLSKNSFRWAEKGKRHMIQRETDKSQEFADQGANDSFETVSVLNDFLQRLPQNWNSLHLRTRSAYQIESRLFFRQGNNSNAYSAVRESNSLASRESCSGFRRRRTISVSRRHRFHFLYPLKMKNNSSKAGSFSSENQNGTSPISKSSTTTRSAHLRDCDLVKRWGST